MCSSWDAVRTRTFASCTGARRSRCCPAKKTSASCRSRRRRAGGRSSRSAAAARSKRWCAGETGVLVDESTPEAFADGIARALDHRFDAGVIRRHAEALQPRALRRRDDRGHRRHRGAGCVVNRHNRLLVTFHVLSDAHARRDRVHHRLRAAVPQRLISGLIPITKGMPPLQQYINVLPFIAVARAARLPAPGAVPPAARPLARRRLLRRLRRQHPRGRVRHRRDVVRADLLRDRPRRGSAARSRSRSRSGRSSWSSTSMLTFASRELVREAARAPLARRHRPQANPDCGLGRAGPPGRRQDPRAPRARLSDRRLRRRQGRRRSPRLPRPAAARHDRRGRRHREPRGDRPPLRRAAARAARPDAAADREHQPRVRRRQGGAGPAPGHRAARAPRGSRRRPGHQHQRRPAPGLQRDRQARDRHRDLQPPRSSRWPSRSG